MEKKCLTHVKVSDVGENAKKERKVRKIFFNF